MTRRRGSTSSTIVMSHSHSLTALKRKRSHPPRASAGVHRRRRRTLPVGAFHAAGRRQSADGHRSRVDHPTVLRVLRRCVGARVYALVEPLVPSRGCGRWSRSSRRSPRCSMATACGRDQGNDGGVRGGCSGSRWPPPCLRRPRERADVARDASPRRSPPGRLIQTLQIGAGLGGPVLLFPCRSLALAGHGAARTTGHLAASGLA